MHARLLQHIQLSRCEQKPAFISPRDFCFRCWETNARAASSIRNAQDLKYILWLLDLHPGEKKINEPIRRERFFVLTNASYQCLDAKINVFVFSSFSLLLFVFSPLNWNKKSWMPHVAVITHSCFFGISSWIICFKKNGEICFSVWFLSFLRPHPNEHVNKFRYIMSCHRILYSFCWFLIWYIYLTFGLVLQDYQFYVDVNLACMSIGWHFSCILHLYEGCSAKYIYFFKLFMENIIFDRRSSFAMSSTATKGI